MELEVIPDIIDNSEYKLSDVLNSLITPGSRVYIATGYFNIEGFALIRDKLQTAKEVKILIGKALSSESIITAQQLESRLQEEIEEKVDERGIKNLLDEFISFLQREDVQVRIFKDGFYHGKFYVIDGGIPTIGSVAIVGSSNLTFAGLTNNTEYNSVVKQQSAVNSHKAKFMEIFNDKADDYKPSLNALLSSFTSQYSPYDVYMKILYSYFEDKLVESPGEEMPSPIVLADFQKDGYMSALQALEKYGGVILADSVGLGKTYLALRLLDDFAYRLRQKAVIICPAQIKDTLWEPKLREFGIRADILTQEKASRELELERFSDYDIIVIDESHNFRNSSTKRWKNLFEIVVKGKDKKIILITATPVNNSVFDLYNQIRFVTKDKDEFFKLSGIATIWGYFLKADRDKETLFDLLEEIAVRRSRPFIKKYYPNAMIDGKPVKFPERILHTAEYNLSDVYSGIYKDCESAIEALNLASYNIESFRKDIFQQKLKNFEQIKNFLKEEKGWSDEKIKELLMKLGRNEAVIAILRILFLKRLESSVEAFRISVDRLLNFQRKFLEVLDKNKVLDRESYIKFYSSQAENDIEEDYVESLAEINFSEYEIEEIKEHTKKDIEILEMLYNKLSEISYDKDSKLRKLVQTLQSLKDRKIVIFGYFKDTMRYVYKYITRAEVSSRIGIAADKISIVDSEVSPEERKDRIIRFSPVSNEHPEVKGTDKEIQILISTDVLSEGQNLQDADTIINYDLPWNPVKIVQRIGRIDRIGSLYDFINVYNFFPEDELESLLNLLKRLYEKIEAINRSVGLDASVLGETPSPKDFGYIKDIFTEKKQVLDELEELSELAVGEFMKDEILRYVQSEGTKKVQKIPNGVGSCMRREGRKGVFAAFKDDERHYWCFFDLERERIMENRLECIKIVRCDKTERYIPPPEDLDVYQIIRRIKNHIISRLRTAEVKPTRLKTPQNHIVNWLQTLGQTHLVRYFSTPLPDIYLKELRKIWYLSRGMHTEALLKNLEEFKDQHPITDMFTQTRAERNTQGEEIKLKLVAYMTVRP